MKHVICKRCGVAHECAGRMSNEERARKAALARTGKAGAELAAQAIERNIAGEAEPVPRGQSEKPKREPAGAIPASSSNPGLAIKKKIGFPEARRPEMAELSASVTSQGIKSPPEQRAGSLTKHRPSDICPHGKEYRFCRMGTCAEG
jgi:hypothetical protein